MRNKNNTFPMPSKSGSGCGCLIPVAIVAMIFVLFFVAPQVQRYKTLPKQPDLIQQLQHLLPGSSQSSTTKQHSSVKLTAPSGSCFDMARQAAIQNGIDPTLYARQINQESGCQSSICSSAGACGVAQLMPEMATSLGVNRFNVSQSLSAGAHLMAGYLKAHNGSWAIALACYNAGTGAVQTALSYGASWYAHLPLETQNYITSILGMGVQS